MHYLIRLIKRYIYNRAGFPRQTPAAFYTDSYFFYMAWSSGLQCFRDNIWKLYSIYFLIGVAAVHFIRNNACNGLLMIHVCAGLHIIVAAYDIMETFYTRYMCAELKNNLYVSWNISRVPCQHMQLICKLVKFGHIKICIHIIDLWGDIWCRNAVVCII